jgi:hypothetical protein
VTDAAVRAAQVAAAADAPRPVRLPGDPPEYVGLVTRAIAIVGHAVREAR